MLPDMDLFRNVLIETEKLPPGQWLRWQAGAPSVGLFRAV